MSACAAQFQTRPVRSSYSHAHIPFAPLPRAAYPAPVSLKTDRLCQAAALLLASGLTACKYDSAKSQLKSAVSTNSPQAHHAHTNRLAREKSPYLLQHQHNPVDWFAWGEEAFAKARAENKPIFLSIGYSTCHWCHVMERESFENEKPRYLNQHFVSIKVDREERPDVDKIYMTFVQAMTGPGGWPLNVFLTPDLKPFYGGTYWPPEDHQGRPSFLQVLQQIQRPGRTAASNSPTPPRILHQAQRIHLAPDHQPLVLTSAALTTPVSEFKRWLRSAPRRLRQRAEISGAEPAAFLLRYGVRQDHEAIHMVLHTCERMAAGGIYDQLGGGFSRYSVDAEWLVPHFEKMLYDNAQLLDLYLEPTWSVAKTATPTSRAILSAMCSAT